MNITINAEVNCTDGFYGHVICIILNPETEQITHIAVQQEGVFSHVRLVPVSHIMDSTPDQIQLDVDKRSVEWDMLPFFKTEFLEKGLPEILYTTELMWPHLIANLEMKTIEHENIPLNELAVHSGAVVEAEDGIVGNLENFIVNPDDKHVTQIVVRTGRWFVHSRLAIPVSAIDHFEDDKIYLSISREDAKARTVQSVVDKEQA